MARQTAGTSEASPLSADSRAQRRAWLALFACCTCPIMGALDIFAVNLALPHIGTDFHTSVQGLQWVADVYVLAGAGFILSAGALGDRFGRKRMFQLGQLLFVLASFACSLAPNVGVLIAFRAVQAIGWAAITPTSLAIITNMFPDAKERAKAIGFWSATGGFGVAAGPILGGILVNYVGWRSIFWLNIPIGAAAITLTRIYVTSGGAVSRRRLDPAGQLSAIAALTALVYALIEGPDRGWTSPFVLGLFVAAAVLVFVFVSIERRVTDPLLELSVFRIPSVSGAAFCGFVAWAVLNGFLFTNTLVLQDIRALSPIRTGLAMLPATVMMTIMPRVSGRLTGRYGPRLPILISFTCFGLSEVGLLLTNVSTSIGLLAIPYALLGIALGFMSPPLTVAAVESMPVERAGVASGLILTARQVGSAVGLALLGSVVTSQLYGSIHANLTAAGISSSVAQRVDSGVHAGRFSGYSLPAAVESRVHEVVATTFTDGVHWENVTSLILLALGICVAAKTMNRRRARPSVDSLEGELATAEAGGL